MQWGSDGKCGQGLVLRRHIYHKGRRRSHEYGVSDTNQVLFVCLEPSNPHRDASLQTFLAPCVMVRTKSWMKVE